MPTLEFDYTIILFTESVRRKDRWWFIFEFAKKLIHLQNSSPQSVCIDLMVVENSRSTLHSNLRKIAYI